MCLSFPKAEKENLQVWFDAGVTCVGLGSKLISKKVIEEQAYARLTANVKKTLSLIKSLKTLEVTFKSL